MYWCLPDKEITDGLVLVENQSQIYEMIKASKTHKTLVLFVDHTDFLRQLRPDVAVRLPFVPKDRKSACAQPAASSSCVVVLSEKRKVSVDASAQPEASPSSSIVVADKRELKEIADLDGSESDSDFELYDSDYIVDEGDDDLFAENIDNLSMITMRRRYVWNMKMRMPLRMMI